MGLFEAIYIDLKKMTGSAVNFVLCVIFVVLLLYLVMNGFIFGTCPVWFVVLFIISESMILGFLRAKRFRAACINAVFVLVLFGIAVLMSDGGWIFERQPLEKAVVKFEDGPAIELLRPRILAKQIRSWNRQVWPVFDIEMEKPDPKKNIILLGGFTLETTTGFWQLNYETTNVSILDVKKIRHMGKVVNNKEITLRNGKVISGTCLVFTNFMSLNPGMVWIKGETPDGEDMRIDFEDFDEKGEYIEFYWQ